MTATRRIATAFLAFAIVACGGGGGGTDEDTHEDAEDVSTDGEGDALEEDVQEDVPGDVDEEEGPPPSLPGGACTCDSDCQPFFDQEGICVYGVCMIRASATCSSAGSTAECPPHHRCWGLSGHEGSICWPLCSGFDCVGTCDGDGVCTPSSGMDCDGTCGSYCSEADCTPGSCPDGEICYGGRCIPDYGDGPGTYPGISCDLPPLQCEGTSAYCGELIQFDPTVGYGYYDYAENGETTINQYRSWLRRDVVMLTKYAAAMVACKAEDWTYGNPDPIGLIDMSEEDGAIPGTSTGSPGHPPGTHTNGRDIDIAYYQEGTGNNRARIICAHTEGGSEAYHCTDWPHLFDPWRQALFLGALYEHPALRVVGCDGKVGPLVDYTFEKLCDDGWIAPVACTHPKLTYEETDMGYGWYRFHHHHIHVSFSPPSYPGSVGPECLVPGCDPEPLSLFLEQYGLPLPVRVLVRD